MKKRIIPTILIDSGGRVITSKNFKPWRTVGVLMQALRMHDSRGADEIIIIDIYASVDERTIEERLLQKISENIKIPVTIGGGIKSLESAKKYVYLGADKIALNSACFDNFDLIEDIASSLGSQALVVNVNYIWSGNHPIVYDYRHAQCVSKNLFDYLYQLEAKGVGEIILTSVEKDGTLAGYDEKIIAYLKKTQYSVPIILSGGAGRPEDFKSALESESIAGAAAGSIFSFTEHTPSTLRAFCIESGIAMRRP